MLGRRTFLGTVGATAAALVSARALGGPGGGTAAARAVSTSSTVAAQLRDVGLAPSARFHTSTVQSVVQTRDGAVAVGLADRAGRPFEVLLLGHDPRTPGVARAGSLGVYMKNKGDGATATTEEHGLAAMALARHLGSREASGAKLPALLTLSERAVRV